MAEIKNVTGTAFIVAEWRAEENAAPDPLYRDSIVEMFLDDATRQAAENAVGNQSRIRAVNAEPWSLGLQHGFEGLPTEWWHFDFKGSERFAISDQPID